MKKNLYLVLAFMLTFTAGGAFAGNPLVSSGSKAAPFKLSPKVTSADYLPNTIIFRLKPEFKSVAGQRNIANDKINQVLEELGVTDLKKMFPTAKAPTHEKNSMGLSLVDLTLIYVAKYSGNISVENAANMMINTATVLYAEPKYIYKPLFTPNDPSITNAGQYFIAKIRCDSAWSVNTTTARGDTNVVIGIVDTGTDWDHPDLVNNLKFNYADPIDGVDNDADGYVDNYRGWDMADSDNDPIVTSSDHGSHVSGCADASTNNGTGVASPGYNCKFLPVKASEDADPNAYLVAGYEGITYAAEHGCQVINCSWGGTGGGTLGQNVIDYAAINLDAVVFAAAGNDGLLEDFFPASYNHVYSIASTGTNDKKSSFSNYGYTIDMAAPGSNIYSTLFDNGYSTLSGTSMASPIASGAAAIVKSFYGSTYNSLQVAEKLRVTCDNIDALQSAAYQQKLGRGRVNLYHALTHNSPSVRMINIAPTDNNDNVFVVGDTVRLNGDFFNYLDATSNLTVTLTSTATAVTILNNSINVGALATLGTFPTNSNPFSFKINPSAAANANIVFKLNFSDGSYTDLQYVLVTVNVDYINITINEVWSTNTSKGNIGYNATGQTQGLGFAFHDSSMMYESGLMIGTATKVVDNVRGATGGTNDADLLKATNITRDSPSLISDFDLSGSFTDNGAATADRIGVSVKQRSFAWDSVPLAKFIIFQYNIKNPGTAAINDMYAGIFTDWDITEATYNNNHADYDATNRMGYVYNSSSALYGGTKLLTHTGTAHCYNIDNVTGGGGGVDASAGFTTAQKFTTLSTDRFAAGVGPGIDILNVVSTGPIDLAAGDSVMVAFALIAGVDLASIQASAVEAQKIYDHFFPEDASTTGANLTSVDFSLNASPNPASNYTNISYTLKEKANTTLRIFDITGSLVLQLTEEMQEAGTYNLSPDLSGLAQGIYTIRLTSGQQSTIKKLVVSNK